MKLQYAVLSSVAATVLLGLAFQTSAMQSDPTASENDSKAAIKLVEAASNATMWKVDNRHSSMVFAVSHRGLSYVYGRFNEVAGTVTIDADNPEASKFEFQIDPASIDTNDSDRDQKLRSEEFLDVSSFDAITFKSTDVKLDQKLQPGGNPKRTFTVGGNLTMHGETRRVVLPIDFLAAGEGVDGANRCGFMSKFVIRRSDHGVDAMLDAVGDSIAVTFCFQVVQSDMKDSPRTKMEDASAEKNSVGIKAAEPEIPADAKSKRIGDYFR